MDKRSDDPAIVLKIELSIPTGMAHSVRVEPGASSPRPQFFGVGVDHPVPGGSTFVRPLGNRQVMCVHGSVGGDAHVAARVFPSSFDPSGLTVPPAGDNLVRIVFVQGLSHWLIDELPVDTPLGAKKLVVWVDNGTDGYVRQPSISFTAVQGASTYCEVYGPYTPFTFAQLLSSSTQQDAAAMPERWRFTVAGCSNLGCGNCSCLNGEWVIVRDNTPGIRPRWINAMDHSFADARQPGLWRLTFNDADGYWYLDCVASTEQLPGSWISYRRHESAWNPHGPNVLHCHTNSGYCNVPSSITLTPA